MSSLRKFRVYLLGMRFKIVTDCAAFKMAMAKKEFNARVARWALELAEFDCEIEHRAAERMRHVDALSRVVMKVETVTTRIMAAQDQDERICALKELAKNGPFQKNILKMMCCISK